MVGSLGIIGGYQSSENNISPLRKFTCGRYWPLGGDILSVDLVGQVPTEFSSPL